MEQIQVGEYVRTNKGEIAKVVGIDDDKWLETTSHIGFVEPPEDIKKHSKNIIDLIGVGDIVEIFDVLHNDIIYIWSEEMLKALKEDIESGIQIKAVLTKEQFENMQYKVED